MIGPLATMNYFKTSYATLQQIAKAGRFEDVAGFLVLARHATGLSVAGFDPYKLSGAGINSIHEKAGVSEENARGVMERLKEGGFIRPVSPETRKAYGHARWEVMQGKLDLDLPHVFVDSPKGVNATSPMKRVKDTKVYPRYAAALKGLSDTELRLDALMLLLAIYLHTDMDAYGGLDPKCAFRKWEIQSQVPKKEGIRWGAEPDKNTTTAYVAFMAECLQHDAKVSAKATLTQPQKDRFWNAWHHLQEVGLIYEAVSLFDTDPESNGRARQLVSIRINDFHAGSISKTGDPSLLRKLEDLFGTERAYYTPAVNDREEPEAMWVILPDKRGALVGIWRPRFRPSTSDVGAWIDKENAAIDSIVLLASDQA